MTKEKKALMKSFKAVVEDLLDNYELYTEEEKAQVKDVFEKVSQLNQVLDKYDIDNKLYWAEFMSAFGQYFNSTGF